MYYQIYIATVYTANRQNRHIALGLFVIVILWESKILNESAYPATIDAEIFDVVRTEIA